MPNYKYNVRWLEADQEYVGTCESFPFLSHLDTTPELAIEGIKKLVEFVLDSMNEK